MTNYNFTVRARDNAGAFADREFSINVRNTIVDRFVMVGASTGASSQDGVTLATQPSATGNNVVYGAGKWIAYTDTSTTYKISTDAINWETYTRPAVGTKSFITYGNGQWMTFGSASGHAKTCYTSSDGITWTARGNIPTGAATPGVEGHIAYGNGKWLALQFINSEMTAGYVSQDDGDTWTSFNVGRASLCYDVQYINGLWFITDEVNFCVWTSVDGSNWTKRVLPGATSQITPRNIVYGNGVVMIAMGNLSSNSLTNIGWRSIDSITWTTPVLSGVFALGANQTGVIAFAGGKFVFTGGARLVTSVDGATLVDHGTNALYTSVAGIKFG